MRLDLRVVTLLVSLCFGCNMTAVKYTTPTNGTKLQYVKLVLGKEETEGMQVQLGENQKFSLDKKSSESNALVEMFKLGVQFGTAAAGASMP